jgi:hypothetical protein
LTIEKYHLLQKGEATTDPDEIKGLLGIDMKGSKESAPVVDLWLFYYRKTYALICN